MSVQDALYQGQEALQAGRWQEARAAFQAVLQEQALPEALAGLGDALFWLGDVQASVACRERAYALYRRGGNTAAAAESAFWLCMVSEAAQGNVAASKGWLARCESLLQGPDAGPLEGWLEFVRAVHATDHARCRALLERALAAARSYDDPDLELCALGELGVLLVKMGDVDAGMRYVDEAMVGALGGEGRQMNTVVVAACSMMTACDLVADLPRATQWSRAAYAFTQRYGSPYLYAYCRTVYANVLLATGRWAEAEAELVQAAAGTRESFPVMHKRVLAGLALLRVRQGRADEAAALIESIDHPHETTTAAAEIALAGQDPGTAVWLIERWLQAEQDHPSGPLHAGGRGLSMAMITALCLLVQARLAVGDHAGAGAAARQLEGLAAGGAEVATAYAAYCRGQVQRAGSEPAGAVEHLQDAARRFERLDLPFETARARLELARAVRESQPGLAAGEARAALSTFERLGASRDADAAASLLRSWGAGGRTGPRDPGVLTRREREILELLAAGLSNLEIAERLYISPRTAAHHVSNVLAKLGVRNRAEAAAYAARSRAGQP